MRRRTFDVIASFVGALALPDSCHTSANAARLAMPGAHTMAARRRQRDRELIATGATARKRTVETTLELTPQEAQIARLAREGYSNPEIGSRLFLSPRTVEWHMSRVFSKLGVKSRRQLRDLKLSPAMLAAGALTTA